MVEIAWHTLNFKTSRYGFAKVSIRLLVGRFVQAEPLPRGDAAEVAQFLS